MRSHPALRVLVVDDDENVRESYRAIIARQTDVELAGEATDGNQAEDAYAQLLPDVVLMDLQMPQMSGIDATRALVSRWPEAIVVAMTTFGSRDYVVAALRAGASGYLLKDVHEGSFVAALRQAVAGEMPLSASIRRALVSAVVAEEAKPPAQHDLTPREEELIRWLARGLTNAQIARQMHLSEGSVKQYMARASSKLGVASRTQLLISAIQLGVVDPLRIPPPRS
ncbi:MAG: response regulator transcription factor [Propioniciclava sp.]|uniref:response regulator n=1 Tax=Propioniciclava sp. TaxID=2038686 RepID=UPI0039E2BC64